MIDFDDIWQLIVEDIRRTSNANEFAPTKTSQAIGRAIWGRSPTSRRDLSRSSSLDVGTGTGVHALLMAARGYGNVTAIDSSVRAIAYAQMRWARLKDAIVAKVGDSDNAVSTGALAQIQFEAKSVDEFVQTQPVELVTFNPTAYFDFLGTRPQSPLAEAVYGDDDWSFGHQPEHSAVYRFFNRIAFPYLEVGGSIFCTWFGLERRLVGIEKTSAGDQVVHPVRLLQKWFPGVHVRGRVPQGRDFYSQTAQIMSDYGLGPSFRTNLMRGYDAGLYSALFSLGSGSTPPEFPFGVLHLVRDSPPPNLDFHLGDELK